MAPRHAGLLAALAAVWGGSYLLIKYALEGFEPAVIVWVRLMLAGIVLFAVMRARNGGAEARAAAAEVRARPGRAVLLGALAIALPFNLITFGELEVPSGLTAVLIAPASLFVAAFAPFLDASEKARPSALGGMFHGTRRRGAARRRRVPALRRRVPRLARHARRGRVLRPVELRGQALRRADLRRHVVHLHRRRRGALPARGDRDGAHRGARPARAARAGRARSRGHGARVRDLLQADRRGGRGHGVARVLPRPRDRAPLRRAAARRIDHRRLDRRARAHPRRRRARVAGAASAIAGHPPHGGIGSRALALDRLAVEAGPSPSGSAPPRGA